MVFGKAEIISKVIKWAILLSRSSKKLQKNSGNNIFAVYKYRLGGYIYIIKNVDYKHKKKTEEECLHLESVDLSETGDPV